MDAERSPEAQLTGLLNKLSGCEFAAGTANYLKQLRASGGLVLADLKGADGATSFFGSISIDRSTGITAHNLAHEYWHRVQLDHIISEGGWPAWAGARLVNSLVGHGGFGPLDEKAEAFGNVVSSRCGID